MNLLWWIASWFGGPQGDAPPVVLLPTNIIVASQSVTDIKRRISYTDVERSISVTHARRTVTFDG